MTKPKMAEGSMCYGSLVETSNGTTLQIDCEGDLHIENVDDFSARPSPLDAIRALYEGGPLRPLWDAAINLISTADKGVSLGELADAFDKLRAAVDDMKEPTP